MCAPHARTMQAWTPTAFMYEHVVHTASVFCRGARIELLLLHALRDKLSQGRQWLRDKDEYPLRESTLRACMPSRNDNHLQKKLLSMPPALLPDYLQDS